MPRSGLAKPLRKTAASPRKRGDIVEANAPPARELDEVIASIQRDQDWPRIVELYYWTREPGMLELLRTLIAMPERTRASLEAFCAMAQEPGGIVSDLDGTGRLILTSVHAGQAAAIMRFSIEEDDAERPLHLN
jgi:hypothetical protein